MLESLVSEQASQISRYQQSYDALSERYTMMNAKMYEQLAELNAYKVRVEELEGKYKRLVHDWNRCTEAVRESNETFSAFEARVLRLDEHINNIHRKQRSLPARFGMFLLQLVRIGLFCHVESLNLRACCFR